MLRHAGAFGFASLMLTVLAGGSCAAPPNILVILADDLGYGDVKCFHAESKVATPHLDQLAREGMRFTDAHSPSTVCTPSRYSLLTGRMCFRTGLRGVFTGVDGPLIEARRLTIAEMLHQQGYRTACVGKWHVGMTFFQADGQPVAPRGGGLNKVRQVDFSRPIENGPTDEGFDYFYGTACCPTTDWLYAYIENDRVVQPPTELVRPETKSWLEYEHFRAGLRSPAFDFRQVDLTFLEKSQQFLRDHQQENPDKPFFLYHCTQAVHLPAMPASQFVGATDAGPQGDFIFEFDHIVGQLMRTLEELNLAENTLVIVTSDNGPEIISTMVERDFDHDSAGPWRGFKRDNWEGGHRVPFIARWPGTIPPNSVCEQSICLTDIMATCAEIAGASLPDGAAEDSHSILPLLKDSQTDNAIRPYTLHQTISNALGIRRGDWKWLAHPGSGGNNYDTEWLRDVETPDNSGDVPGQLYNLQADPHESNNVYEQHPDVVAELTDLLKMTQETGRSR